MRPDPHVNPEHAELERWLRSFDDPQPSPATMAAARRAVRVALDEERLARAEHPAPPPDVLQRVRETVRRELGRERAVIRPATFRRSPAFGGLAAAAAIIGAVTLGWMSSRSATNDARPDALTAFELALDDAGDEVDEQLVLIAADLALLEAEFSTASRGIGDDAEWIAEEIDRGGDEPSDAGGDS